MTIHTCTRCPLRFVTRAELTDHMRHDHHMPTAALEAVTYPGAHDAKPLYRSLSEDDGTHRVLLVANQTIGAEPMMGLMRDRAREYEKFSVFVLVPATPSSHLVTRGSPDPDAHEAAAKLHTDDAGLAQARWRLRQAMRMLSDEGIVAHGKVGDPSPLDAITRVMAEETVDEIVLCTLHHAMSRWLQSDIPTAIRRRFAEPLTVITIDETEAPVG